MRPTEEQAQSWLDSLRRAARPLNGSKGPSQLDLLERDLVNAMKRDKGPAPANDGYSSGPGLGRGGSELTSVEAAADARIEGKLARDELHEAVTAAADFLHQCVLSLRAAQTRVDEINRRAAVDKPTAHKAEPVCKQPKCEDPAPVGRQGNCPACHRWLCRERERTGNGDLMWVREQVINERVALRENRKVHVNGPEAVGT